MGFVVMNLPSQSWAQFPGDKLWEFATGGEIYSSPALADDGTIYFGSRDKKLYALAPNGRKKWEFLTKGAVDAAPTIGPDGTIYICSADNTLYAVSPEATNLWEFATRGAISEPASLGSDGTIYVVSEDGNLYAVNPNGSKKWQFATSSSSSSTPTVGSDGSVYVGTRDPATSQHGFLYALKPDGTVNWRYSLPLSRIVKSSCIISADGKIMFKLGDTLGNSIRLEVLRPNGDFDAELFLTGISSTLAPTLGDGGVIFDRIFGAIYAFNAEGSKRWNSADLALLGPPALSADGLGFAGSSNGRLCALDIASGTQKWAFIVSGRIESSPIIGKDGTVYFGSTNGKFYAVVGSAGPASAPWPMYRRDAKRTGAVNNPVLDHASLGVNMYAGLAIKGNVGARYRIEYSDKVPAT